jgi:hypothetical protein
VSPTSRVTSLKEHNSQTQKVVFSGRKNSSRTKTTAFFVDSKPVKLVLVKEVSMVFPVRTKDFQINIEKICRERNDSWSTNVLSRIQFVQDLHAADAVYHQKCSVNFRTGKCLPSPTPNKKSPQVDRTFRLPFRRPWII